MNGRVRMYNGQKGFGFIIGEDKESYFFHISDVISVDLPETNSIVEFEKSSNEKGLCAKKISITNKVKNTKNAVVVLGNVRIKVSNIKNYGVTKKEFPYEKVFVREKTVKDNLFKKLLSDDYSYKWKGETVYCDDARYHDLKAVNNIYDPGKCPFRAAWDGVCSTYIKYTNGDGIIHESDTKLTSDKLADDPPYIMKEIDCLYITTYQNDNFVFRSDICGFDIFEKVDEIDNSIS